MLVDLFDTYEQQQNGLATQDQLDMRVNLLKLGLMQSPGAKAAWSLWKPARDPLFVDWFEMEIYGGPLTEDSDEHAASLNMRR